MTNLSKKMLIPMAAIAIIGAGAYGVSRASAASSDAGNGQSSLIQKLADTFHVDKSKVQAVFDADHQDREAAMETKYEARLAQAVADGQLTSAQKDLVLAEHKKLKAEMDALRDSQSDSTSMADRKAAMHKLRTESQDWAKTNNIDAKWLIGGMGRGHMMGHDSPGGPTDERHMDDTDADSTVSPSPAASSN